MKSLLISIVRFDMILKLHRVHVRLLLVFLVNEFQDLFTHQIPYHRSVSFLTLCLATSHERRDLNIPKSGVEIVVPKSRIGKVVPTGEVAQSLKSISIYYVSSG